MSAPTSLSPASEADLRSRLRGSLSLPGEPGYEVARPWNLAIATSPGAVVHAADATDVRTAVLWAGMAGMRVAVHATGHGSVGLTDDVLVIHTGALQDCGIDTATRIARVGAGVTTQRLLDATHRHGLAPVAGSVGSVGVVGHLSGGGIGPLATTLGAASDHVHALEVITGDGQRHRVTRDDNDDLLWAMRGGKGALGIITAAELNLLELTHVYGGTLHFAGRHAPDVVHRWAHWSSQLPDDYTTSLSLTALPDLPDLPAPIAGQNVVAVRIATPLWGDATPARIAAAQALLAPLRAAAPVILDGIDTFAYPEMPSVLGDGAQRAPVHQDHILLDALPPAAVNAVLGAASPQSGSTLTNVEIRRLGGAVAGTTGPASAFSHRDSPYALGVTAVLADADPPTAVAHADHLMSAIAPWARSALLANFVDTTDPRRLGQAYDTPTATRLRALADRHDPAGVFAAPGELPRHSF